MKYLICVALLCLVTQGVVQATEVSVVYKEGTYYINALFEVTTSPEKLVNVLTDYENITQFHPSVLESEILSANERSTRLRTVVKDCVFIFCKKIIRVENIRQDGFKSLEAEVLPMLSDLRMGQTKWEFIQRGEDTAVSYKSSMQPKFWIPPFIRSHTVTNKLEHRITEIIKTLQTVNFDTY